MFGISPLCCYVAGPSNADAPRRSGSFVFEALVDMLSHFAAAAVSILRYYYWARGPMRAPAAADGGSGRERRTHDSASGA